jgi:hypothetical protein
VTYKRREERQPDSDRVDELEPDVVAATGRFEGRRHR